MRVLSRTPPVSGNNLVLSDVNGTKTGKGAYDLAGRDAILRLEARRRAGPWA